MSDSFSENLDLYFDDSIKLANSFSLIGIPTSIIINKKGEEFARIMGPIDFTDKKFVEWFLAILLVGTSISIVIWTIFLQ